MMLLLQLESQMCDVQVRQTSFEFARNVMAIYMVIGQEVGRKNEKFIGAQLESCCNGDGAQDGYIHELELANRDDEHPSSTAPVGKPSADATISSHNRPAAERGGCATLG